MSTKRLFKVSFEGAALLELDQEVLDQVDDEWRESLYNLQDDEDVATHVGFNLIFNNWKLSHLDGFANLPDTMAKILGSNVDLYAIWSEEVTDET